MTTPRVCQYALEAAERHGVPVELVLSRCCRKAHLMPARRYVWRKLRDEGFSLNEIGRMTGGFHYTTVLHGLQKIGGTGPHSRMGPKPGTIARKRAELAQEAPPSPALLEVLANIAAMNAKHQRELAQRY